MGVSLRSRALGEAAMIKSLVWIEYCHPIPDTYLLKFMIKSQRCWWSWWNEMGPAIMMATRNRLTMQQRVERMHQRPQHDTE